MEKPLVLGVDIGGSHITAALVNLETRTIAPASYKRRFVNAQDEADTILNSWCNVIDDAFNSLNISQKRIGIAMPGPFDYKNGICLIKEQNKFQSLYQLNIKTELAKRLNISASNIQFINDAVGFLQGEVFAGAAKNTDNVLGITLGTGLGSALYINGVATDAALWDSVFLNGIAEDYLSTRWFVERYYLLSGKNVDGVKDLMAFVFNNHPAEQVLKEFGYNLAQFLIPLINQYELEIVIIGGNISLAFDAFSPELNSALIDNHIPATIRISKLKENAALIGAASCWEVSVRSKLTQ